MANIRFPCIDLMYDAYVLRWVVVCVTLIWRRDDRVCGNENNMIFRYYLPMAC